MTVNVYYSPAYAGAAYAFETTRKAKWVADSLEQAPIAGVRLVEPVPLTREQVTAVHDPDYVRAVETGDPRPVAESQGFRWDPGLYPMVLASNGGAVAAALDALQNGISGSLSSGLHHARRFNGAGYCTFNGLVIAAKEALAAGAGSVLILDLDAHCGGGTASLISSEPRIWQSDVAVEPFDYYRPPESFDGQGVGRITLRLAGGCNEYLHDVERALSELAECGHRFDLCLYNAGMDPFEGCSTGGLSGITEQTLAERERMVFEWLSEQGVPAAFVLAGGYIGWGLDEKGLVDLHRLTLAAAAHAARVAPTLRRLRSPEPG